MATRNEINRASFELLAQALRAWPAAIAPELEMLKTEHERRQRMEASLDALFARLRAGVVGTQPLPKE